MTFTLSVVLLGLGIVSYGVAGVRLSVGSASDEGALRSSAWWWGTGLQGCGFILTFFARQELPLLFVQSCVIAALAVTALLGQFLGVHRLTALDGVSIIAMISGLILLSFATEPGPAALIHPATVPVLVCALILGGAAVLRRWSAVVSGLFAGLGFGVAAVAARLLAAQPDEPFWQFWTWSGADWLHAFLIPLGLAVGQVHLTKGLATGHNVPALGAMYLASTVVPTLMGLTLLGEQPRPGTGLLATVGIALTLLGAWRLIRLEAAAQETAPR